jgi:PAS domain S-box-containing protein
MMRVSRPVTRLLPGCLAAVLAASALAAEPSLRFGHLTVEDGLSNSRVLSICKDSRGFMWFGTAEGLNRFDGNGFHVYRPEPDRPGSLPFGAVMRIFEDKKNRLWLGSGWGGGGLALLDRERDLFRHFPPTGKADGPSGENVEAIVEDGEGALWLGTEKGLDRLDAEGGAFTFTAFHNTARSAAGGLADRIRSLLVDRSGRMWVGSESGLFRFDRKGGHYARVALGGAAGEALTQAWVASLYEDPAGQIWIGTLRDGLFRLNAAGDVLTRYLPEEGNPHSLATVGAYRLAGDAGGTVYVGTENGGLNVFDPGSGCFTRHLPVSEDDTTLASAAVNALYFDDQGILWIGTFNGGINFLSPQMQRFRHVRARRGELSDPHVVALLEDHAENLWIATDGGGLDRLDRKTGVFTYYRHDAHDPGSLGSDAVLGLHEDAAGNLWVATYEGGVNLLRPGSRSFVHYRHDARDPASIRSDSSWVIVEDGAGGLLVGTERGVEVLDPRSGRCARLSERHPQLVDGLVWLIVRDPQGNLWLAGNDPNAALQRIDARGGAVTRYRHDPKDAGSLGRGLVYAVHVDSQGRIWAGTEGGLCVLDAASGKWRRFTSADGLPHDSVTSILEDGSGSLWLGTNRGLAQFVAALALAEKPVFRNFDVHDGLQGHEFRNGAALRTRAGELFFGGQHGLNAFFPEQMELNRTAPPVVLTKLSIFNREQLPGQKNAPLTKPIGETRELTLSYTQSVVTFEFAALNFIVPQKNQYAYRLEGFDKDWNRVGAQRTATYTNLSPGDYTLRVRGSNNDGLWNEEGATLRLRITPPFWKTWWFEGGLGLISLAGLFAGYRLRMRASEQRRRELETEVAQRTSELQQEIQGHRQTESKLASEVGERARAEQEAKRAAAEAGRERDLLHTLMDNIPDLIYFKDTDGRFTRVNQALARSFGLAEAGEAVGRTVAEFVSDDLAQATRQDESELVTSGRPLLGKVEHDSRAGRWYLASKVPFRDAEGRVTGLVGISKDITGSKAAEEKLAQDLRDFQQVVAAAARGDLTCRGQESEETLGRIASSVNAMLNGFGLILSEASDAAFSVSAAASEILAAATQIAKGAQYGSDQVHSTSAAVEEMATSMGQVSRHADASAEAALKVLEHVRDGDQAVEASHLGMTKIDSAVSETAEKMRLLEKRSRQVFAIISLIEEIASRSELLSLNAAIEAAHAGEAGVGFGVVADEIRRLADRSTAATKDVQELVEAIVEEIRAVAGAMENATHEVASGRGLSDQARGSLREIGELVQVSVQLSTQISEASREQAQATRTVAGAMQAISNTTLESAGGARETTNAVRDLVQLSESLTAAIARFKLKADG